MYILVVAIENYLIIELTTIYQIDDMLSHI